MLIGPCGVPETVMPPRSGWDWDIDDEWSARPLGDKTCVPLDKTKMIAIDTVKKATLFLACTVSLS